MEKKNKKLITEVSLIFKRNKYEILQIWLNLLIENDIIKNKDENRYFVKGFEKIIEDFSEYLTRGDFDSYYKGNKVVAEEIAFNDISFKKFIKAFHLFEKSYSKLIVRNFDKSKLIDYFVALDQLHHNTIAIVSEAYFEIKDITVFSLAKLAELRDPETAFHLERTREYSVLLAKSLEMKKDFQELIYKAGPLHDIGKVGIRDNILLKPAKLTTEEYEIIKEHTRYGWQTIDAIIGNQNVKRGYLFMAKEICLYHHEKYDGSGYPEGLSGENIPVSARIFALADAYDAIVSKRPYKEALPHKEAVRRIKTDIGTHFDPKIVNAFLKTDEEFCIISRKYI